jgi:DNA-directed RNA polymerase subunit RPC12/RpoP
MTDPTPPALHAPEPPPAPPPLAGPATAEPPAAPAASTTPAYSCAGCGARVEYAPGTAKLRCPYCGHEQAVIPAARTIHEHSITELATKPRAQIAAHVLRCQHCGATSETNALATRCQFCGSPLVADAGASAQIPPEAVLPFEVDKTGVRKALRGWVSSRWFAPKAFRKVSEAESLVGTYIPHWTFDADTTSQYTGERGEHYWVTETYTTTDAKGNTITQTRQVQRTRWYPASGTVARFFDDVMVRATAHVADERQDKLEPWPLKQAVAYQPEYLAGYSALRYDVEPEAGLATAKARMAPVIERDCRDDIGGDEQRVNSVSTAYAKVTFKLMLLPVWVVCYLFAGRPWQVLVNGRTAEVIGQRPYSVWKIAAAVLVAVAIITGIIVAVVAAKHGG